MEQKTKKMINKIKTKVIRIMKKFNRFLMTTEPENLLKWIQTAPSEYDKDRALVNRMNYYVDYAKRF